MSAAPHPHPISILDGKYALLRQLGSGSTGTVYEAENLSVGKKVALKLMKAEEFAEPSTRERFVTEARAAARISHANVVDIQDLGVSKQGVPYLVMELLRGETLSDLIDTRGPLSASFACELLLQVLAGLSAAHAQGIVHGDLKPDNVLVTHPRPDRPLLKVLDFGIARAVAAAQQRAEAALGSQMYLSPEQVASGPIDFRSDVYQASVMLFTMLAGQRPFEGPTPRDVLQLIAQGKGKDLAALVPELPRELVQVVKEGMALRPQDRIPSAEELAERLRPFLGGAPLGSLAPQTLGGSSQPFPLLVAPTPTVDQGSGFPRAQGQSSVIPVHMPRVARVRDSLLMSPRIPRAPSTPKLRMGKDFMPMPGDPDYEQLQVDTQPSQARPPRAKSGLRRDLMPAVLATTVGFALGVVLAWSAGLL